MLHFADTLLRYYAVDRELTVLYFVGKCCYIDMLLSVEGEVKVFYFLIRCYVDAQWKGNWRSYSLSIRISFFSDLLHS